MDYEPLGYLAPWLLVDFDVTLGFPGEGPPRMKIVGKQRPPGAYASDLEFDETCSLPIFSCNVTSLETHFNEIPWNDAAVYCIQEVGADARRLHQLIHKLRDAGLEVVWGAPVTLTTCNGVHGVQTRAGRGGVGIMSRCGPLKAHMPPPELQMLAKAYLDGRFVHASLAYGSGERRLNVLCYYGVSGSNGCNRLCQENESILLELIAYVASLTNAPLILAMDGNIELANSPVLTTALRENIVVDAAQIQQGLTGGSLTDTYCLQSSSSVVWGDKSTSRIDYVFLNPQARLAFKSCVTDPDTRFAQHVPINVKLALPYFSSESVTKLCYEPVIDFKACAKLPDDDAEDLANGVIQPERANLQAAVTSGDVNEVWRIFNVVAVSYLSALLPDDHVQKHRMPARGARPKFRVKPALDAPHIGDFSDDARAELRKLIRQTRELELKLRRWPNELEPNRARAHDQLCRLRSSMDMAFAGDWSKPFPVTSVDAVELLTFLINLAEKESRERMKYRIAKWTCRLRAKVSEAIRWMRNGAQQFQLIVTRADGTLESNPERVHKFVLDAWGEFLFAESPDVPAFLCEYSAEITALRQQLQLGQVTGDDIYSWVKARPARKLGGGDSWRTPEAKLPPPAIWAIASNVIFLVENRACAWPEPLGFAPTSLIHKDGPGPLQKRPIAILPILYAAYTAIRYRQTAEWQRAVLPVELYGGRAGLSTASAELPAAFELQLRKMLLANAPRHQLHEICINEDRKKCFDLFKADLSVEVMRALGMFVPACGAIKQFYRQHERCFKIAGAVGPRFHTTSLVQGCAMSLLQKVDKGLGFTVNYGLNQQRSLQNKRVDDAEKDVCRALRLPHDKTLRIHVVEAACVTQITYGTCMVLPADRNLFKLRTAILKCIFSMKRALREPRITMALLYKTHRVDPKSAVVYSCIAQIRAFLRRNEPQKAIAMNIWRELHENFVTGPMAAIKECFEYLGWSCSPDFPWSVVRTDDGESPVNSIHFGLTLKLYAGGSISPKRRGDISTVVAGSIRTGDRLRAANLVESCTCIGCELTRETPLHCMTCCPAWDDIRAALPVACSENEPWFQCCAIDVESDWIRAERLKLANLAERPLPLYVHDAGPDLPVAYTDGSCRRQAVPELRRAGYGFYIANTQQLEHWSALAGLDQTSIRAETRAVLSLLQTMLCPVSIFCDCRAVVVMFRLLLDGAVVSNRWANEDLWAEIALLLSTVCVQSCIRKVRARTTLAPDADERTRTLFHGNRKADALACAGADDHDLTDTQAEVFLKRYGDVLTRQVQLSEIIKCRWHKIKSSGQGNLYGDGDDDGNEDANAADPRAPAAPSNDVVQVPFDPVLLVQTCVIQVQGDEAVPLIPIAVSLEDELAMQCATWRFKLSVLPACGLYFAELRWATGLGRVSYLELLLDLIFHTGTFPLYRIQKDASVKGLLQTFLSTAHFAEQAPSTSAAEVFRAQEEGQYDPADFKAASQQADLHSQQVSGSFTPMQVRNLLWMPQVELADQIPWQQTSYHGTWHETTISHGLNPPPEQDRSRTQLSLPAGEDRSRRQLSLPGGVT
ncbi:unnamed protein product [Polarella glacialis]|uniref:RNase H type-1 domain-containing protein n=1 Tax=Polarella glacialis TaxID=89957 RepID=A0A813F0V6_POLGL|nr:unnamed protein product [Polarella glacialis]